METSANSEIAVKQKSSRRIFVPITGVQHNANAWKGFASMPKLTPLLISVAPNGARKLKRDHPALPLSPRELAEEAERCEASGARLFHLHVRTAAGGHSLSPDLYRDAISAIRSTVGDRIIIQATTESCGVYSLDEQIETVKSLCPEAASFALREFLPDEAGEERFANFFRWVADAGILTQYILYSPDEARQLGNMIDRGLVPFERPAVLFVLGRYADGISSDPAGLFAFIDAWKDRGPWSVCAFGPTEIRVAALAVALGGHVRVGFENNLSRPGGDLLSSNAEQVDNVVAVASAIQRQVVTVESARASW